MTAGQHCQARDHCSGSSSSFVSVKPLDAFKEAWGHFSAMLVATKPYAFEKTSGQFPAIFVVAVPKACSFPNSDKVLQLNLFRPEAHH